jgi:hypothetical protein
MVILTWFWLTSTHLILESHIFSSIRLELAELQTKNINTYQPIIYIVLSYSLMLCDIRMMVYFEFHHHFLMSLQLYLSLYGAMNMMYRNMTGIDQEVT